jgi:hypothetical protein
MWWKNKFQSCVVEKNKLQWAVAIKASHTAINIINASSLFGWIFVLLDRGGCLMIWELFSEGIKKAQVYIGSNYLLIF